MCYTMKHVWNIIVYSCLTMPYLAFSQSTNEASEPAVIGPGTIDLIEGRTLDEWKVPSGHWSIEEERIVGQTGGENLEIPEWLYTKQRFSDFVFTCELKLTGDDHRNTGIYYRVNTFRFESYQGNKSFEAPSGYEFDAAFSNSYTGSLGDWYTRPSLRIYADQAVITQVYKPGKWNRMTIRAYGNRLEYWINGIKIMDYLDHDPKAFLEGVIGLQLHDGSAMRVEFRNIRVRPLED